MRCFIGVDLGSTTTKSVVLDERCEILGRGITNSRSNYDVACAVAQAEALTNVRFTLCARALNEVGMAPAMRHRFLAVLERSFRLAQHRASLDVLATQVAAEAPHVERFFDGLALAPLTEQVIAAMRADSASLFAEGAIQKSDFFRDLATSHYHRFASQVAFRERVPLEALMSVFDKAILGVENQEIELDFGRGAGWAIAQACEQVLPAHEAPAVTAALEHAFSEELEIGAAVGTGYGRARLPFPKERIRSEILCHGLGAHLMFPRTATVLDIGGQDTKAIQVDASGVVTSFQMNDRCAAGCGRYLGYIADEMNLGLHELSPLAERATRPVKINSTCTVFAGAEIRDRLTLGQKREDVLAGLHRAVILRATSLLARSGGIRNEFTFTGGVAKNPTAVKVLAELVRQNYGSMTINVSPDSIYTGALGAALFAERHHREARSPTHGECVSAAHD